MIETAAIILSCGVTVYCVLSGIAQLPPSQDDEELGIEDFQVALNELSAQQELIAKRVVKLEAEAMANRVGSARGGR